MQREFTENEAQRVSEKTDRVVAALRAEILGGALPPQSQLPTLDALERRFLVTRPTVVRALRWLKRDGFVYASSTRGVFVTPRPPHLHRYGVVFSRGPNDWDWNRFWAALASEAAAVGQKRDQETVFFYGINRESTASQTYRQLQRELRAGRFAGLVIVGSEELKGLPFWAESAVPKVVIWPDNGIHREIPHIHIDRDSFVAKSLDYLGARGCRRVAVLTNDTDRFPEYPQAMAARGIAAEPYWFLTAGIKFPEAAHNIIRLLMHSANRPEGLVVADDNLVEHAMAGLIAAGVRVPEELEVVAHCNWSFPVGAVLPAKRLGYDVHQLMETCLVTLETLKHGQSVPPLQLVPAVFEDERSQTRLLQQA